MSINDNSPTFDHIAAGWYNFRHHTIFKTELETLALRWKCGKLLNVGCGHGADFLPFKDSLELFGIDISSEMLKYAEKFMQKHGFKAELQQADMRTLPFPDDSFEFVLAVASIHHIERKSDRMRAFQELYRVLKPGGEAFITLWNAYQPRFIFKKRDIQVPWRNKDEVVERFYHLFSFGEAEFLVKKSGFKIVYSKPESRYHLPIKYFSRNICLLIKKP
jgi:ubiquinone/menaquinone biosynthesis C-methylase UbiE